MLPRPRAVFFAVFAWGAPRGTPAIRDPDKPLLESGLDSLDIANFFLSVEEKYGIKIDDADLEKLNTIRKIVAYLQKDTGK